MSDATSSPKTVVDAYIKGTATRDIPLLKSIFHGNAVMTGWLGPDLLHGGPEPFYGALEGNEVGDDYSAEITTLQVDDKIATASITERNLLGMSFENHFQMVQLGDGTWRLSSKLFRHD
ncbi:MAG: nuclear transport factor 2 family protein [Pseudomonadota bacterium]